MLDCHSTVAMQNAMSIGQVRSVHARKFDRHDRVIEQRQQPLDGANKSLRLPCAPIHVLRPVECGKLLRQLLGENVRRGAPFALDDSGDIFALLRGDLLERRDFDSGLLGKGVRSGRWFSVLEGDRPRGACELLLRIGLGGFNPAHQHGQPPRRGVAVNGISGFPPFANLRRRMGHPEPFSRQDVFNTARELRLRGGDHTGGDFFKSNFKEKIHNSAMTD